MGHDSRLFDRERWHDANNARISRLVAEMVRLHCRELDREQSAEYEASAHEYLQALCDRTEYNRFEPPEFKEYTSIG